VSPPGLGLAREIGSFWDEAHALASMGRCALAVGRIAGAEAGLGQAQDIFQRIGAAEAPGVAAELRALTEALSTTRVASSTSGHQRFGGPLAASAISASGTLPGDCNL
jgi:hypothetical protein